MEKIRVLRIIARLNVGGPARHVIWLTSRLSSRFDRILVTGDVEKNEDELSALYREEKVQPIYLDGLGRSIGIRDIFALFRMISLIREYKPDIVHTHTSKGGFLGRLAVMYLNLFRRKKIKTVHTFHGHVLHSYFSWPVTMMFRLIEKFLGRFGTDRIVTITQQQLDEIAGTYKIAPREKFRLIRLAIDLDRFEPQDRSIGERETIKIGFVGRLTAIKNPRLFLRAGGFVIDKNPKARLVVIGDGELRGAMLSEAHHNSDFLGNRDDIYRLIPDLDVLVISSHNEGTPVSVLEAFASGTVVACTKAGGCIDLLADGRGLLSELGDATELADNIMQYINDPELVKTTREKARKFVLENYNLKRLVGDIESLYDELIAES